MACLALLSVEPVGAESTVKADFYSMDAWTYILQGKYGSPEVDQSTPFIRAANVSDDKKSVRLIVEGLVCAKRPPDIALILTDGTLSCHGTMISIERSPAFRVLHPLSPAGLSFPTSPYSPKAPVVPSGGVHP